MAETRRRAPTDTGTPATDRAVELITGPRRRGPDAVAEHADPALDAAAVAAAAIGRTAAPADPAQVAAFGALPATLAASGLMSWRVKLAAGWRRRGSGPVIATPRADEYRVYLPSQGLDVSIPGRRTTGLGRGPVVESGLVLAIDCPADTRWWRLVAWSLRRRRPDVLALLGLGLLGGLTGLLLPFATSAIFGSAVPQGDGRRVVGVLAAFAVGALAGAVIAVARGVLVVRLRDSVDSVGAPALFARVLRSTVGVFGNHSVGEIANRATAFDSARAQVDDNSVALVITSAFGLVNLLYLLAADVTVGLITAAASLLVLVVAIRAQLRARDLLGPLLDARSAADATLLSLLSSLVTWRVAAAEDRALARWAADQALSTRLLGRRVRAIALGAPVEAAGPAFVLACFTAAVIVVPSTRLAPGSAGAPGAFLAMYAAAAQLTVALVALTAQAVAVMSYGPALSRAQLLLATPLERASLGLPPGRLRGEVSLSQVTFGYAEDRARLFDDLSLTVAPGEFVAIVGPSGSGKSTLLRLLMGFETPNRGTVSYDGRDLAGLDPVAVRSQLGVVLQASRPIGPTIAACVAGPRLIPEPEIWSLLELAGLAQDVRAMPMGLQTEVGGSGGSLSGGQRQRLAIAAALAGDPAVLLFDEATSALDNITQSVVMNSVLASSATRIVIAHRMSTVMQADRILVLAGGRIVEQGPPAELLATDGHFAKLVARQEA